MADDPNKNWGRAFRKALISAAANHRKSIPKAEKCCVSCGFGARFAARIMDALITETNQALTEGLSPEDIAIEVAVITGAITGKALRCAEASESNRIELAQEAVVDFAKSLCEVAELGEATVTTNVVNVDDLDDDAVLPPGVTQH